ncbi:N-acyl-D-amino-acid deacylase family protein [Tomitella cavernea]|uniref:D-aminoacylase n=1 Tax=Tomitella cavernea TaxID=1387982 RepID=A0ABP9D1L3_9ACTN|nr:amidohydrolase family protein [Tomitella cavernea]
MTSTRPAHPAAAPWDTVIRGGTLIDGTGAPGRSDDVAVAGDTIAAVGPRLTGDARAAGARIVDADAAIVAPGFIDLHTHADFTLLGRPSAETQLAQGVTTVITGNCGQAPFPLTAAADAPWTDARGFGDTITAARPAVNVGLQAAHNAIRATVMGQDDRPATPAELDRMCATVAETAGAPGVVGFSTGLIYMPGLFAQQPEIEALAAAAAAAGLLYSTHMRNESADLLASVDEAINTAENAGARLEISHLKAMGPANHGLVRGALERIDVARARGVDVAADVYPYTASSTDLSSRLPGWAVDGGRETLLQRLADPALRARIADGLRSRFGRDVDPGGVIVAAMPDGDDARYVGRSLTAIGEDRGTDPAEAAITLLVAGGGGVNIVNHAMSADDVRTVLAHPQVSVASDGWVLAPAGDGVPHPRSFGTFARVLGRYTAGGAEPEPGARLDLPEAVRKMTSLPATRIRASDRGVVAPGNKADLVVFDPASVLDLSTYASPWALARGVSDVFVGGVHALAGGTVTGARGGVLIEREPAS